MMDLNRFWNNFENNSLNNDPGTGSHISKPIRENRNFRAHGHKQCRTSKRRWVYDYWFYPPYIKQPLQREHNRTTGTRKRTYWSLVENLLYPMNFDGPKMGCVVLGISARLLFVYIIWYRTVLRVVNTRLKDGKDSGKPTNCVSTFEKRFRGKSLTVRRCRKKKQ